MIEGEIAGSAACASHGCLGAAIAAFCLALVMAILVSLGFSLARKTPTEAEILRLEH